jgi:hypothetical protein
MRKMRSILWREGWRSTHNGGRSRGGGVQQQRQQQTAAARLWRRAGRSAQVFLRKTS